ncbi:MAG: hypothetical protein LBT75_01380 [Bacilli bacterium]|jgi:hypothetical protein|nr:hypothetical protein [Bacilli bacterium]
MNKKPLLLMNTNNITRDLVLLDLYHKDLVFYLTPSVIFLNAIGASVIINLILNDKIRIDADHKITIIDQSSIRTYNKLVIQYINDKQVTDLKKLAQELFLDIDFSLSIYDLVIKELVDEDVIVLKNEKKFILTKTTISLKNPQTIRSAYQKLHDSLFKEEQSQEFIALALLVDTFFDVNIFFDEDVHTNIQKALTNIKETKLFNDIKIFKEVIDEFFQLSNQQAGTYWF